MRGIKVVKAAKEKKKYTLFTGKQLLWLILPIIIEQIFSSSLGFIDSIMVSNMPGDSTSASLAVTNIDYMNNLIIQLFSAFATGGAIITSQFLGAKDSDSAKSSAKHMLIIVIIASVVIAALSVALNYPLLRLLYSDIDPSSQTFTFQSIYFYITAASFPFIGLFNACAALLRVQRKSVVTMSSAAISCGLNAGMNAIFLYVAKLGVMGAALATLICRAIPAVYMLFILGRKKNTVCVRIFEKFKFEKAMIKKILKIAIPAGIESALFQLGKLMTSTFVNVNCYIQPVMENGSQVIDASGKLKTINIQALSNSIANHVNNYASMVGSGVGTSCLTVIGQAVGTGDVEQTKYYMKKMFLLSYIANSICVALFLGFSQFIVQIWNFNDVTPDQLSQIHTAALNCLYFCLAVQMLTYPLSFTTPAILKATSDVKYVMFSAVISMFVMRVGLSFLMTTDKIAGLPQLGAFGYWIGMCSDWVLRSVLFMARLLSGKWKKSSGLFKDQPAAVAVGADGQLDGVETAESIAASEELEKAVDPDISEGELAKEAQNGDETEENGENQPETAIDPDISPDESQIEKE
ncbi:MAG: polysaccharide biosynthesis C-terminal domain-containing protein [Clostridia bacterium]|nr:polysaccharide biosynthesis C-terminal domain-containing protein [Clostridia bacterium]